MQFYSQCGQDKHMYEKYFPSKRNGIFLDIGAYDGVTLSNTHFFEKEMGWTGICIEPNRDMFAKLVENRPKSKCLNLCIGFNEIVEYQKISGYSSMLSGITNKYDSRMVNRVNKELQTYGGKIEKYDIESKTIHDILKSEGITDVDFCSVDAEGSEENILSGFDPTKVNIRFFVVENNFGENKISDVMSLKGYKLIGDVGADQIYEKEQI